MKVKQALTVRVPEAWRGRISSEQVQGWLLEWCRSPSTKLPADPGPGHAYLRLSLPRRAVRTLAAAIDEEPSAALRRLIRSRCGLPAGRMVRPLPSALAAERVRRPELVRRAQVLAAEASAPPLRRTPSGRAAPGYCPACGDWTLFDYYGARWLCTVCEARNRAAWSWGWEPASEPMTWSWGAGRSGWSWWDALIVAGVIALGIWLVRRLSRAARATAKPVVVPVEGRFLAWVPKR